MRVPQRHHQETAENSKKIYRHVLYDHQKPVLSPPWFLFDIPGTWYLVYITYEVVNDT